MDTQQAKQSKIPDEQATHNSSDYQTTSTTNQKAASQDYQTNNTNDNSTSLDTLEGHQYVRSIPKRTGRVVATDQTIGRWEINFEKLSFEKKIGQGNFGEVWLGELDGSKVAIKSLLSKDEKAEHEFAKELKVMLQVRAHENVVLLKGFCRDPLCLGK